MTSLTNETVPLKVPLSTKGYTFTDEVAQQVVDKTLEKKIEFAQLDTRVREGYGFYWILLHIFMIVTLGLFIRSLSEINTLIEMGFLAIKALKINALFVARQAKKEASLIKQESAVKQMGIVLLLQTVVFGLVMVVNFVIAPYLLTVEQLVIPEHVAQQNPNLEARIRAVHHAQQHGLGDQERKLLEQMLQDPEILAAFYEVLFMIIWNIVSIASMAYMYFKAKEIRELLKKRKVLLQEISAANQTSM